MHLSNDKKIVFEYSPKIVFKFSLNLWQHRDIYETETFLKPVFFDGVEASTLTGAMMMRAKSAFEYLKTISQLTVDSVDHLIEIIGDIPSSYHQEELVPLLETINSISSFDPEQMSGIFYKSIKTIFFGDYRIELAKLICNCPLIKAGLFPMIMTIQFTNMILDLMKDYELNKKIIINEFDKMMAFTKGYNTKANPTSIEELRKIIKTNSLSMMKERHIKNVYIFGSYARSKTTEYSDIDIAVSLYPNYKITDTTKKELTAYFHALLKNKLDVAILTKEVNIDHPMFKDAIRIF